VHSADCSNYRVLFLAGRTTVALVVRPVVRLSVVVAIVCNVLYYG